METNQLGDKNLLEAWRRQFICCNSLRRPLKTQDVLLACARTEVFAFVNTQPWDNEHDLQLQGSFFSQAHAAGFHLALRFIRTRCMWWKLVSTSYPPWRGAELHWKFIYLLSTYSMWCDLTKVLKPRFMSHTAECCRQWKRQYVFWLFFFLRTCFVLSALV